MVQVNQSLIREFIKHLKKEIAAGLPGMDSQYKMAPRLRLKLKPAKNVNKAAVLLLLYPHHGTLFTVLTKRTEYSGVHSGQISFPGGKYEEKDMDIVHTALRESREELGILANEIKIIGILTELYIPISKILVSPVVGYTDYRPDFKPDPMEVEFIIESPLRDFLKPETLQKESSKFLSRKALVPYYIINGNQIWGATAMILSEFIDVIRRLACPLP